MKVITTEDIPVLIPNNEHKNFTASAIIIPKGTQLTGAYKIVNGLRKREPFKYRLFYTNNNQIIYTKNIKPITMEKTEVRLSAEGAKPEAIINIPKDLVDRNAVYGIVFGAAAGFGFSAYKQKSAKEKLMFTVVGAVVGFCAAKIITKKKDITIKK